MSVVWFPNIDADEDERSQCLLRMKVLAADNMKTNTLHWHLETVYDEYVGKHLNFSIENNKHSQALKQIFTS
jgi:hypothetical protein